MVMCPKCKIALDEGQYECELCGYLAVEEIEDNEQRNEAVEQKAKEHEKSRLERESRIKARQSTKNIGEILSRHVGEYIGVNLNDPTKTELAELLFVGEDFFGVHPEGVEVTRYYPFTQILSLGETYSDNVFDLGGVFKEKQAKLIVEVYHSVVYKGFAGFSLPL